VYSCTPKRFSECLALLKDSGNPVENRERSRVSAGTSANPPTKEPAEYLRKDLRFIGIQPEEGWFAWSAIWRWPRSAVQRGLPFRPVERLAILLSTSASYVHGHRVHDLQEAYDP
jgi:hypothetical protein